MKRIGLALTLAVVATLLVVMPVLASYFAYIYVHETAGNTYDNLPVICEANITQLVATHFITSSGLDTRVLTGSGDALPHMLANDKILFSTDLEAYEDRTLIFYTGATALSNFPVIVGSGGSIRTPDDPTLEPSYVFELLTSGYFNSTAGTDKNILYKEDAFKMGIQGTNNLTVQSLNTSDTTQWEMHYDNFTTGEHDIYVTADGLQAFLYVDNFVTPKDTQKLYANGNYLMSGTTSDPWIESSRRTFYANGLFWCFYKTNANTFGYRTSPDGITWAVEQTFSPASGDTIQNGWSVTCRNDHLHIAYAGLRSGTDYTRYMRGTPEAAGNITWDTSWETASSSASTLNYVSIGVDTNDYPFIAVGETVTYNTMWVTKSSTNNGTWTTAGGYPLLIWYPCYSWIYDYYNTNEMYVVTQYVSGSYNAIYGMRYNGSVWQGEGLLSADTTACANPCAVSDDDGNLYIVWEHNYGAGFEINMRIRYADSTWSPETQLTADGYYPSISYNPTSDTIYVFYQTKTGNAGRVLAIHSDYTSSLYAMTGVGTGRVSTPYSDQIGVAVVSGSSIYHEYFTMPYEWNLNANDWYWMMNNAMPYADLLEIAVDGTLHCHYEPADIIHGNTLPDLSPATGNDGIINWGENPTGVSAYITPIQDDEAAPAPISPNPNGTAPGDMVGPTGQPGSSQTLPTLPSNPLYPFLAPLATLSGIPLGIMWILFATFLVVMAMIVFYRYVPHLLMTVLIGGGLSAFFYSMGIYPFWVLIIFVIGAIAIIVSERMPSID